MRASATMVRRTFAPKILFGKPASFRPRTLTLACSRFPSIGHIEGVGREVIEGGPKPAAPRLLARVFGVSAHVVAANPRSQFRIIASLAIGAFGDCPTRLLGAACQSATIDT